MKKTSFLSVLAIFFLVSLFFCSPSLAADKEPKPLKIVLIAGKKSHGFSKHEHYASFALVKKWFEASELPVEVVLHRDGFPADTASLSDADVIVLNSDGGAKNPARPHLALLTKLAKEKKVGVMCLHYALEIPKGEEGDQLKSLTGGYFETWWSINPIWRAEFKQLPKHPVANGVKPFSLNDEWYYNMRFVDGMKGVTPILSAVPPASTLNRGDSPHGNNPHVRKMVGQPQHLLWAYERPDGGRGAGFTGGHWHWSWQNKNFRTLLLNAIYWTAGGEVPQGGVPSTSPTVKELLENQDYPANQKVTQETIDKILQAE